MSDQSARAVADTDELIARLEHNMTNQAPNEEQIARYEELREYAKDFGRLILNSCPESRERSVALTNLEQALMWAVASIARNG